MCLWTILWHWSQSVSTLESIIRCVLYYVCVCVCVYVCMHSNSVIETKVTYTHTHMHTNTQTHANNLSNYFKISLRIVDWDSIPNRHRSSTDNHTHILDDDDDCFYHYYWRHDVVYTYAFQR